VTEREKIFSRIGEALRVPAPLPGHHGNGAAISQARTFRQVLPPAGIGFEEKLALFRRNATYLKAEFVIAQNKTEAARLLAGLKEKEQWTKVGYHRDALVEALVPGLNLPKIDTTERYEVRELESCSAGISACDALIAQTGSLLVTGRSAGGRALSVLPPHHVALATAQQLLSDLPEAFALLKNKYEHNYPSFMSLITGPSRTGDIERILVLGAHGPRKLTILLVMET